MSSTEPWLDLQTDLARDDVVALRAHIEALGSAEVARAVAHLSREEQTQLLERVGADEAAEILSQFSRSQMVDVVEHLEPAQTAAILHELPVDTGVDILRDLDAADAASVLAAMPAEEAVDLRDVARWDDEVAGGLMGVEFIVVSADATMSDVVVELRQRAEDYLDHEVQYLYVVDEAEHLIGVLPLRKVVLAPAHAKARDRMIPDPLAVQASASLDEVEELFDEVDFFALPVLDGRRMVGVLPRAVVMEAVGEHVAQDHLKAAGIIDGDELRSMALRVRAMGRLKWLSLNIGLNVVAASVIASFQDTLQSVVALAVFLPIISDMSGCSGNQAVAVSMRELSLGVTSPQDTLHVLAKELAVGLVNGSILGLLLGVVSTVWMGNPWLGVVAGGALAVNTLIAVSIGGSVPLLAKRFGFDPALASGPVLTTVTDVCGFTLALGMATLLLDHLV